MPFRNLKENQAQAAPPFRARRTFAFSLKSTSGDHVDIVHNAHNMQAKTRNTLGASSAVDAYRLAVNEGDQY